MDRRFRRQFFGLWVGGFCSARPPVRVGIGVSEHRGSEARTVENDASMAVSALLAMETV